MIDSQNPNEIHQYTQTITNESRIGLSQEE